MNSIWFCSFALVISANWCELQAFNMATARLAGRSRKVVLDHPLAPRVLGIDPVALIRKLQNDQWRADFFGWMEFQMG